MKTKHLLWALALPAVFAACQSDEFESTMQENNALLNRPMAGDVKIDFGFGEATTRLDQNFKFELGDEIGATLMDEYKADGISGDAIYNVFSGNWYKFVDYIQTNYRYTNTENGWENSNLLCAGNYFFYYPYTPTLNARKAFENYLNPNQVLKANTREAGREMVNDNQMYVGYSLVEGATEGSTSVLNVEMQPVFAFPLFTLECKDSEVTIQKIALQYIESGKEIPLKAVVAPASASATAPTTNVGGSDFIDYAKDPVAAVSVTKEEGDLNPDAVTSTRQIQVTFPEGTVTKNGQLVNAYMVIPEGNYTGSNAVQLLIYTDRGLVTADLSAAHENATGSGAQYNVTNDVAMGEVYGDIEKMDGKKYRVINIKFDEVAITKPQDFTATSTEDLDTYIKWFASIGGNATLKVKSTSKDVTLTKAACEILNANSLIDVTIKGDITIAADAPANAYNLVTFSGDDIDGNDGQTVYNKATLEGIGNITTSGLTIVNEGSMTLTGANYANIKLQNKGVMNINGKANQTTTITLTANNTDFVNEAAGTLNINALFALGDNYGIGNYGTVNINNNTEAKIENLFKANPDASNLYHAGTINVKAGATWKLMGTNAYSKGTINNYGKIEVPSDATYNNDINQTYTNAAGKSAKFVCSIYNYGSISNITNNGNVEMMNADASYSTVSIAGGNANGYVNNTVCNNKITACATETIYCEVSEPKTFTEVNEFIAKSNSSLVRFVEGAETLTIDVVLDAEGKPVLTKQTVIEVDAMEIASNLTIATANKDAKARIYGQSTSDPMEIIVNEGVKATLGDFVKLHVGRSTAGVSLEADGVFEVTTSAYITGYNDSSLEIEGTVYNYGKVAGAKTAYTEGTTTGWTGNAATTTKLQ